ncbi:CheR family methyltransferase [Chondromyces apiculatus]|uniref:protein-glutamate O-methyltransferase n=1 Tax=Chondromyces apiculatus DSM 436 TaxID=1192034 RepID=A0A017STP9_9BACT|nr:protein-glutamate O-methyltransferase CheR [Chondromyces apiculatus]EYF00349.1 Chemotaxis protein methyltransferase CheR [Chondromyces apiculatus DSM 436]
MNQKHDDIRLSPEEFRLLRELFNQHCGLQFGPESRLSVERRLRERLAVLGHRSFGEYHQYLRHHPRGRAELDEALDAVTVNETYFFREDYQLRALRSEIVPMLVKAGGARNRLSIWSAGCSTGEEVYSIAMVAHEAGLTASREVRVFGSDISRRCIAAARRGVYGSSSFRAIPPEMRRHYFHERADGAHVVDEIRAMCQFGRLNLLDGSSARVVSGVDIIFCRNVLIYFDEPSRIKVINSFHERLLPGGFLLLGHSESLLNVPTKFELVHLREDLVYRKPAAPIRLGPAEPPAEESPVKPPFQKPSLSG